MAKSAMNKLLSFNPKKEIGWWLFKRSMKVAVTRGSLAISAIAAGVGVGFWAPKFSKLEVGYVAAGVIIGLIILGLALRSLIKFKATVAKSVAIAALGGAYLAASLYLVLNRGLS